MTDNERSDAAPTTGDGRGPKVGDRLGTYQILEAISDRGWGLRFRVLDTRVGRERILEWLGPEIVLDDERFDRETEALAGLRHPNILTVIGSGRESGAGGRFVVFEDTSGLPLATWIERDRPDYRAVAGMFSALARAVGYLRSRGLSLGRLEPELILVELDGTGRLIRYPGSSPADSPAGADMVAIGRTLDRALSLVPGETPPGVKDIVQRCLRPDSDDAYLDFTELASDLTGWHTTRIGPSGYETTRVLLQRIRRRRRFRSGIGMVTGAGLLVAAVLVVRGHEPEPAGGDHGKDPGLPVDEPAGPEERTDAKRVRDALDRAEEIETTDGARLALAFLDDLVTTGSLPAEPLAPRRARLRWAVLEASALDAIQAGWFADALRQLEESSLGLAEFDAERNRLAVLCRAALALSAGETDAFAEAVARFLRAGGRLDLLFRSLTAILVADPEVSRGVLLDVDSSTVQVLSRALLQIADDPRQESLATSWLECLAGISDLRWAGALVRLLVRRPDPVRFAAAVALAESLGGQTDRLATVLAPLTEPERREARDRILKAARACYDQGLAAFSRHDLPGADRSARRARILAPGDPDPLLLLADIHLRGGAPEQALAAVEEARAIAGPTEAVQVRSARALRALGRIEDAAVGLQEAFSAHPGSVDVAVERGIVFYHLRRFREASQELERASGLLAGGGRVLELAACRTWQARARLQLGALDEAATAASEAAELDPGSAIAHAVLALVFMERGESQRAGEAAGISLSMGATDVGFYVRGRLALADSSFPAAREDLLRAVELAGADRAEILFAAGRAQEALGSHQAALELLERASREAPGLSGLDQEIARVRARIEGGE